MDNPAAVACEGEFNIPWIKGYDRVRSSRTEISFVYAYLTVKEIGAIWTSLSDIVARNGHAISPEKWIVNVDTRAELPTLSLSFSFLFFSPAIVFHDTYLCISSRGITGA